jgi:transposase
MQAQTLDTAVVNYINDIKAGYEQRIEEIKNNYETAIKEYRNKYLEIKERYDLLVYKRFVRSAERMLADEKQPLLFTEEAKQPEACEEEPEELETIKSYKRGKAGRKPLSPNLERRQRTIDIPESGKTCACGAKLVIIGEETSEKLHINPMEIFVEQTIRLKYACRCCEGTEDEDKPTVRIAPVEKAIIPKSIASPSVLAVILTQKFEMHLPYYRQEKQFEQIGAAISRQDMSNWQQQVFEKLEPLFALIKEIVKSGPVLQMDETTVQVIGEENREDTQKSYMWLARGGPIGRKVIWYEYRPTHAAYNAREFLQGFSGYLQTDGYEGYDCALQDMPGIIHAGCFAHARRRFFEAAKINKKPQSAEEGIKYIRRLYRLEDALRSKWKDDFESFHEERKKEAPALLEAFKAWLLKRVNEVPPKTLLGEAVGYTLNQWDKLIRYIESPYLTPDNNACENAIRPFVLGRKNWLFSQSVGGAKSSCGMYTLIETAKQNGIVPRKYLTALFDKAPYAETSEEWEKLLPWNISLPS